jgi:hypothetical protein
MVEMVEVVVPVAARRLVRLLTAAERLDPVGPAAGPTVGPVVGPLVVLAGPAVAPPVVEPVPVVVV